MQKFDSLAKGFVDHIALINSLDHWVFVRNRSKNRGRLLDVGCGSGLLTNKLSDYYDEAIGIDISNEMVKKAIETYPNIKFYCMDANHMQFPDSHFDYIVSQHTLHHLNRQQAINQIKRVLKPGGHLVIVDPSKETRPLLKKLKRVLLRNLYSKIKLRFLYGAKTAQDCWTYCEGPEWRAHRKEDLKTEFNRNQTKEFYTKILPECKIATINYHVQAVIWKKSKGTNS